MGFAGNILRVWRTVRHVPPAMLWARVGYRARCLYYGSVLYGLRDVWRDEPLLGEVKIPPVLLDTGDAERGKQIAGGTFTFVGLSLPLGVPPRTWLPAKASALWVFHVHYHEWLADLKAAGDVATARALVADWLTQFASWHKVAWHPYPLSLRVVQWMAHRAWLLDGADDDFKNLFDGVLVAQVRHLRGNVEHWLGGNHVVKNYKALLMAGLCLPKHDVLVLEGLSGFMKTLEAQVYEDGGQAEASPWYQAQVLADVVEVVQTLRKAGGVPPYLLEVAERMGQALAAMRHTDGTLALMNDGAMGEPLALDVLVKRAGGGKVASCVLPDVGYVRLVRGKTLIIMDVGKVGPDENPGHAHADVLSLEVSWAGQRLFGNCGTLAYQHPQRNMWRGTATKATLQPDNLDSAEVWGGFRVGRRPREVGFETKNVDSGDGLVVGWHDGFAYAGLVHSRKVLVAGDGSMIRGEDVLARLPRPWWRVWYKPAVKKVWVRFPLGEGVVCRLESETTALLTLPRGEKVRLEVVGAKLDMKEGRLAKQFGVEVPIPMILLHGRWRGDDAKISWTFKSAT